MPAAVVRASNGRYPDCKPLPWLHCRVGTKDERQRLAALEVRQGYRLPVCQVFEIPAVCARVARLLRRARGETGKRQLRTGTGRGGGGAGGGSLREGAGIPHAWPGSFHLLTSPCKNLEEALGLAPAITPTRDTAALTHPKRSRRLGGAQAVPLPRTRRHIGILPRSPPA